MYSKRRLNGIRQNETTRFGRMNIIHKSFIQIKSAGKSWSTCNPVVKGFVDKPEYWLYSSGRNYNLGDDTVLKVELVQML